MAEKVSAADYQRFAAAVKASDKAVARAIRKRTREAAKPIGEYVVTTGSEQMPQRGGLAALLAAGRPTVSLLAKGASLNLKRPADYRSLDAGVLRHPVFRTGKWIRQPVPDGAFTDAFGDLPDRVRAPLDQIILDVLKELNLP